VSVSLVWENDILGSGLKESLRDAWMLREKLKVYHKQDEGPGNEVRRELWDLNGVKMRVTPNCNGFPNFLGKVPSIAKLKIG
jgi:hypothetical protein